jgi:hypothetical protein
LTGSAIAALGDVVIFNTVDYWSGSNPIPDPEPFPDSWGKGSDSGE